MPEVAESVIVVDRRSETSIGGVQMIVEKLLERMHIRSRPAKLILGSTLTAIVISTLS